MLLLGLNAALRAWKCRLPPSLSQSAGVLALSFLSLLRPPGDQDAMTTAPSGEIHRRGRARCSIVQQAALGAPDQVAVGLGDADTAHDQPLLLRLAALWASIRLVAAVCSSTAGACWPWMASISSWCCCWAT